MGQVVCICLRDKPMPEAVENCDGGETTSRLAVRTHSTHPRHQLRNESTAMINHVSIQCADLDRASQFYDTLLATIGGKRIIDRGDPIGYGVEFPCFWLGTQTTGTEREVHIAFTAPSRGAVDEFHDAAIGLGATVLHKPRVWPEYHPGYYGAFVRDPDGNNIEAVHHTWNPST